MERRLQSDTLPREESPCEALHQAALDWEAIERQADRYRVPDDQRVPARAVATVAFNEGSYELAATSFRHAWQMGVISPTDIQSVGRYSEMLTNWGKTLTAPQFPATREQGEQALATAYSIDTVYGLADTRPCTAL